MGALDAVDVMTDALSRNPILLGAAALIAVLSMLMNAGSQIPLVGLLVGLLYFFVEPYLAGGFLGMANEAVSGETAFDTFTEAGSEHYSDLLVARLVVGVAVVAYLVVVSIVFAVVAVGVGGMSGGLDTQASPEMMTAVGVVGAVVFVVGFLVFAIPYVLLQFYPAAIVIGGAGPMESFRYSVKLVRENVLSVLGYTAIAFVVGLLLVIPPLVSGQSQVVGRALGQAATGSQAGGLVSGFVAQIVVFAATFVVVKTVVLGVVRTYYVSFVRSVTGTA